MKSFKIGILILVIVAYAFGQNQVLSLRGAGDYVSLPQPVITSETFSIEAWYLILGDGGGIDQQNFIFTQRTDASGCYNSSVALVAKQRPDSPDCLFSFRTDQGCGELVSVEYAGAGRWHHLAGVKSEGEIRLYSDGQLVAALASVQEGSVAVNIATIDIGRHFHTNEAHGYFIGMLDEIRIWDYPLSHTEITSRMHEVLSGDENGLIAYWNFDNGTADDATNNGNSGTLNGNADILQVEINEQQTLWGDLNGDGSRNISDVIVLINFILGNDGQMY